MTQRLAALAASAGRRPAQALADLSAARPAPAGAGLLPQCRLPAARRHGKPPGARHRLRAQHRRDDAGRRRRQAVLAAARPASSRSRAAASGATRPSKPSGCRPRRRSTSYRRGASCSSAAGSRWIRHSRPCPWRPSSCATDASTAPAGTAVAGHGHAYRDTKHGGRVAPRHAAGAMTRRPRVLAFVMAGGEGTPPARPDRRPLQARGSVQRQAPHRRLRAQQPDQLRDLLGLPAGPVQVAGADRARAPVVDARPLHSRALRHRRAAADAPWPGVVPGHGRRGVPEPAPDRDRRSPTRWPCSAPTTSTGWTCGR